MFCPSTFYLRALIIGIYPVAASAGGLGGRRPSKFHSFGESQPRRPRPAKSSSYIHVRTFACRSDSTACVLFFPSGAINTHNNDKVPCCRRRKRCKRKPYTCAKCKDG